VLAAHERWVDILNTHDLEALVTEAMPDPRPFAFLAAWVNFELTKNLAEINQLEILHANRHR
jgi:hypothetical protein